MDIDDIFEKNKVSKTIVISDENFLSVSYGRTNSLVQKKLELLSEKGYKVENIAYYIYRVNPQLLFKYFIMFLKNTNMESRYKEMFEQYHFAYDKRTLISYDKSKFASADDEVAHLLKIIDSAERDYFSTKFDRFIFKTFQELPEFLGHSFKKYPVLQKKAIFFTSVFFAAIFVLLLILNMNEGMRSTLIFLMMTPFAVIYFFDINPYGKKIIEGGIYYSNPIVIKLDLFSNFFLRFLVLACAAIVVLIAIVPFCIFWLIGSLFYDNIW